MRTTRVPAGVSAEEAPRAAPPSIPGLPIVGVLPQLLWNPIRFFTDTLRRTGGIATVNIGPVKIYILGRPDYVDYMLRGNSKNFTKEGGLWDTLRMAIGNGLAASDGSFWLRQRRMMQPHFHRQRLAGLISLMTGAIKEELDRLQIETRSGQPVELPAEMARMSMRIIVRTMFGTNIKPEEIERFSRIADTIQMHLSRRIWLFYLPQWLSSTVDRSYWRHMEELDQIVYRLIDRAARESDRSDTLISMLLDAQDEETGARMNQKQLRDEALTIFLAGYETVATACSWAFYILSQHPEVERRLRAEVEEKLQGAIPTFEDLAKLEYTRCVFQETMRIYPPVWLIPRTASQDDVIGGYRIPARSVVAVVTYAVHHDPETWEHPEIFDPERFAPARSEGRPPSVYLPFGIGPRQCIGNNFALFEGVLLLSMLIQRYRVKLLPGQRVEPRAEAVIMRVGHGYKATLQHV
ncbi:MAG TPA: cytochrome P450 [Polyangia bacterium]|nr:cytochrome P450 [Polyangia bacterium]